MKIRIVSDLHVDVNKNGNFGFRHEDQDVLFIAGDIAGSYDKEIKFLNGLSKDITCPIFVVPGNHLGYDYYSREEELDSYLYGYKKPNPLVGTKQWSIDKIKESIPDNIHYLDDEYYELDNYYIFGGCMYSDYKLYENEDLCKRSGEAYLNDFRYVHIHDREFNIVRPVNTDDYQWYFVIFKKKLEIFMRDHTDKDVIVLTHFAPSIKSISEKYINQGNIYLNASYASNLDDFIKDNPRIKYWVHGHVHDSFDYMIEQCHVICEPYGYHVNGEQKISPRKWYGKTVEI